MPRRVCAKHITLESVLSLFPRAVGEFYFVKYIFTEKSNFVFSAGIIAVLRRIGIRVRYCRLVINIKYLAVYLRCSVTTFKAF